MPDPDFQRQVRRLHRLTVYSRWLFVVGCWLVIAPFCLWALREEIGLLQQYFTWTASRYALADNFLPSIGLAFCLSVTGAVLVWQSRNILMGLPKRERQQLEKQVHQINQKGSRHPLWRWIVRK